VRLFVGLVFRGFGVQVDKRRQASKAKGLLPLPYLMYCTMGRTQGIAHVTVE